MFRTPIQNDLEIIETPTTTNKEVWNEWSSIPMEIYGEIIQFLPIKDIYDLGLSCKRLYYYISNLTNQEVDIKGKKVNLVFLYEKYYLPLKNPKKNFGTYYLPLVNGKYRGWNQDDKPFYTYFNFIRIDPNTLMVNNGDFTFAKTTGRVTHHPDQVGIPLGTCFDCFSRYSKLGKGGVDLRGTIFFIDTEFKHSGCCSGGEWKFGQKHQVVQLKGGGHCGWTCPEVCKDEYEAYRGGWFLKLGVLGKKKSVSTISDDL